MNIKNTKYEQLADKAKLIAANHPNLTRTEFSFLLNESLKKPYRDKWTALYNAEKCDFKYKGTPGNTGPKIRKF